MKFLAELARATEFMAEFGITVVAELISALTIVAELWAELWQKFSVAESTGTILKIANRGGNLC